jgi:hypothetical protein
MKKLNMISTQKLVEELSMREGVIKIIADPYEKQKIDVKGPAIILLVTD